MKLPVVIIPGEDGYFVAEILSCLDAFRRAVPGKKLWPTSKRLLSSAWKAWTKRAGLCPNNIP